MTSLRRLSNIYNVLVSRFISRNIEKGKTKTLIKLLPIGICASNHEQIQKIEFQTPKTLTHDYLIKQASSVTVNAASQLLTQTVVAILDTAEDYKKVLLDLISLFQDCKDSFGNNIDQQELSDLIIASRAKANDFKNLLIQLETLLNYVEKVVVSSAETSFLAGAEFVSISLSERLHSAKQQVDEVIRNVRVLENDFLNLQKEVIIEGENEKAS